MYNLSHVNLAKSNPKWKDTGHLVNTSFTQSSDMTLRLPNHAGLNHQHKHQHTCHFEVGAPSAVIQSKHTWSNTLRFMMLYANLKLNTYALLKPSNPLMPVHQRESPGVFKPSSFWGSLHQLFQLFKGPRALIYGKVCPWQYIRSKHKRKQEKKRHCDMFRKILAQRNPSYFPLYIYIYIYM